ncbi:FecR domain-containing protein [Enterobacterales bacterium AE_CKDN230030158-1A_HGKHYDSX7]
MSPSQKLLEEAADWVVTLRFEAPGAAQWQAFERWRGQSEAHRAAWSRAEQVFGTLDAVPAAIGSRALQQLDGLKGVSRRRAVRLLGTLLVAGPAVWLAARSTPWDGWLADASTGTGERRSLVLDDGSRVVLNTASALDIRFDRHERRLHLRNGEVLVTTRADSRVPRRPFFVDAAQGRVEALGTRFSVRQLGEQCQVAVFEHQVEIRPRSASPVRLDAGQQAWFDAGGVRRMATVDDSAALWEQGMLVAREWRLADVLAELSRYRHGVLRCDPQVAELRVSGALSLIDTDLALVALERTLPVRVSRVSRYWVSVAAL